MINFDFFTPTKILFGAGRESEVGKQVVASMILKWKTCFMDV